MFSYLLKEPLVVRDFTLGDGVVGKAVLPNAMFKEVRELREKEFSRNE
jgi:hypothetical protein